MKIQNIKKTKYEQVAEILDKQGYITDSETFKIYGNESDLYKVREHVRIWKKLQADKQFFADKKIVEKQKGHRCHLVRVEGQDSYYKVGKQFYNSIDLTN